MKYTIKIDRSTVEPNPDAGKTVYHIPRNIEVERDENGNMIKMVQHTEKLYTLCPAPKFLYEYEPQDVQCEWCLETFDWSKLESDSMGDDWSDTVCPHCDTWGCCEVEMEEM